jgi:hypothetical protein
VIDIVPEPAAIDAFEKFFFKKRGRNIFEDPILRLGLKELKERSYGSDELWEDFFARYVTLDLRPSATVCPVSQSSLMQDLAKVDPTLKYYCLRATYCMDENAYGGSFIDFLEKQDTGCFFFPTTSAGEDIAVFLEKLPIEPILGICQEKYEVLPSSRLMCFQNKYFTSGAKLSGQNLEHAWKTTLPQNSYLGKGKNAAPELRKEFDKRILSSNKGKKMIEQSIGILVVAGDVNEKELPQQQGPDGEFEEQLFQCITLLNYKFPPELQAALENICKLKVKARKQKARELFESNKLDQYY